MERKGWNYRVERMVKEVKRMAEQEFQSRKCKYCGSDKVVRFGHSKQKQRLRFLLKLCHLVFCAV